MASGCVSTVEEEQRAFSLPLTQYVTGVTQQESLLITACLASEHTFPPEHFQLPTVHGLVSFTGRLCRFQTDEDSSEGVLKSGVVVTVDTISHLTRPNSAAPKGKLGTVPPVLDDADTVALRKRVNKYAQQGGRDESAKQQQPLSAKQRGKRKACDDGDGNENGHS